MRRGTIQVSLAFALILAAASVVAAQPAPGGPPRPQPPPQTGDLPQPESFTNAGVSKWLALHIRFQGWAVLAADGQAVALGSPEGVGQRRDGLAANIRHEYYKAVVIGGKTTRSNLQTRVFDCAGKRQRVIAMDIYEMNNLTGQMWTASNANAAWTTPAPGSLYLRVLERVCKVASDPNRVQ